jgi:hypothetical protein
MERSPDVTPSPAIPDLHEAREALAQLATHDAVEHLEAAVRSLQALEASLRSSDRLPPEEQRRLERELLRFRHDLRDAGILAEQGLAYCKDWSEALQPTVAYTPGGDLSGASSHRHEFSLEA